jgi:hypothetical protein
MLVKWVTTKGNYLLLLSSDDSTSTVQYGISSGNYTSATSGTTTTYNVGIDGWDGLVHRVLLTGLSPSTKYYYICGGSDMSDEFTFTTAPLIGIETPQNIAVVADMGTTIPM